MATTWTAPSKKQLERTARMEREAVPYGSERPMGEREAARRVREAEGRPDRNGVAMPATRPAAGPNGRGEMERIRGQVERTGHGQLLDQHGPGEMEGRRGNADARNPYNGRSYATTGPGRYKWWDTDNFKERPINKTTLKTLERVFDESRYPSEDMIDSVAMHTRMPRKRVLTWFQNKRRGAMYDKYGPNDEDREASENAYPTRDAGKTKKRWYPTEQ